jgi:hypothetical protein
MIYECYGAEHFSGREKLLFTYLSDVPLQLGDVISLTEEEMHEALFHTTAWEIKRRTIIKGKIVRLSISPFDGSGMVLV